MSRHKRNQQLDIPPLGTLLITRTCETFLHNNSGFTTVPINTPLLLIENRERPLDGDYWSIVVLYLEHKWRIHGDDIKFSDTFSYKEL